jgi:hypothetical protein
MAQAFFKCALGSRYTGSCTPGRGICRASHSTTRPRESSDRSPPEVSGRRGPTLILAGLIGGGPVFLGTVVGISFQNLYVYVAFLALAAGAIVYVVAELLNTGRKLGAWEITIWGALGGILLGVGTELVIKAAGG